MGSRSRGLAGISGQNTACLKTQPAYCPNELSRRPPGNGTSGLPVVPEDELFTRAGDGHGPHTLSPPPQPVALGFAADPPDARLRLSGAFERAGAGSGPGG